MKYILRKYWPFILLAVLAFTIHLSFLDYPSQVVFDEVHFGKFVAGYFTHQYFFDIHPPLGKLMIAGFTKLVNVNPVFDFEKIGEALPQRTLFYLRLLPAIFGALFVLIAAWLAYLISQSRRVALIAGFLFLLDNAFLVQSKFILVDIFLLCFEVLTFCFFFLHQRRKPLTAKWFGYLALTGLFFGLTIGVKWTGLATIGIIGAILLAKIFSSRLNNYLNIDLLFNWKINLKTSAVSLAAILMIGATVYVLPFVSHFKLLNRSGPGDAFMSWPFRQELKYGRENVDQPLNFWQKFIELNKTMLTANAGITNEHPFGSRWYSWPFDKKAVYYWNQTVVPGKPGWTAHIFLTGNTILWWLAFLAIVFTAGQILIKKYRRRLAPIHYILIFAFLANILPFIFIKRVAFLYHYLPAVTFAILLLAIWLDKLWPAHKKIFLIVLLLILLNFLALTPLSYGWPLPFNTSSLVF